MSTTSYIPKHKPGDILYWHDRTLAAIRGAMVEEVNVFTTGAISYRMQGGATLTGYDTIWTTPHSPIMAICDGKPLRQL